MSFFWESFLIDIFPERQKELYAQAKTMAWNRVVLGHHYPSDIAADKTYAHYLYHLQRWLPISLQNERLFTKTSSINFRDNVEGGGNRGNASR